MTIKKIFLVASVATGAVYSALGQSDGNPHGWDRARRCDHTDYDPPCGACEGYGGIPTGDDNDAIQLTSCEVVATADQIDEATLVRPDWGSKWKVDPYYEVLIGKKTDPFCFQVFPSNDSIGELCYRADYGQQYYDMEDAMSIHIDSNEHTVVGNVTSSITHTGTNMWIVNQFPWYALGVHQCICTAVQQGSDPTQPGAYPVQYNWTDQMFFIGRETIGIEYVDEIKTLDHWAFGPHHLWSDIVTGAIIRMWQPFNGLQVFPEGTQPADFDSSVFDTPPDLCKKGGATFRIGCDDDGYPTPDDGEKAVETNLAQGDVDRAEQIVPGDDYRGETFAQMSDVLNGWLEGGDAKTRPCGDWDVEELQQLQAMLYLARDARLDDVYQEVGDNRRMKTSMTELEGDWAALQAIADDHDDAHPMHDMRRDGHCHEAVMWYVHHLAQDVKDLLAESGVVIPLLSATHHSCPPDATDAHSTVCAAYQEQVTCASCHADVSPSDI